MLRGLEEKQPAPTQGHLLPPLGVCLRNSLPFWDTERVSDLPKGFQGLSHEHKESDACVQDRVTAFPVLPMPRCCGEPGICTLLCREKSFRLCQNTSPFHGTPISKSCFLRLFLCERDQKYAPKCTPDANFNFKTTKPRQTNNKKPQTKTQKTPQTKQGGIGRT